MVSIVETGTAGATGSDPYPVTGPGGSGFGPGQSLDVTNPGNGTDTTNTTKITGGEGSSGGEAYSPSGGPPEAGGDAGGSGGNGTAVTKPNPIVSSSATITSKATGIGGAGGQGGPGANGGFYGAGGGGGNGYASAYAYNNPSGAAYAYGLAEGGNGGFGASGGSGGMGQIGTVIASGITARAVGLQYGGAGGTSFDGENGGTGISSNLINAVGGASEASSLYLKQGARGGAGGTAEGGGGQAGTAGHGKSELTFDDTTNPTPSTSLTGITFAFGGAGGAGASGLSEGLTGYATPSAGGYAYAKTNLKGDGGIVGKASAYGGNGGGSNFGASGGAASAYDRAYSTTTGTYDVTANVRVLAGQGGTGGGAGGNATSAVAKAFAPHATGGTGGAGGLASAIVSSDGNNGGQGSKGNTTGGNGGTVAGAGAYAYGHSAYAYIRQQAGGGGRGYGVGGVAGTSAQSILDNQVSGRTTGGNLTLVQDSFGGIGVEGSSGGTAGAGGYAQSILDFNDITNNPTHAAVFTAISYAYGGHGGEIQGGTGGGAGANANSQVHVIGAGSVTARSEAVGGYGGGSTGSVLDSGGGNAGNTSVSAYAYSTGGTAKAYGADATGGILRAGSGGTAYGAGQTAGTPGVATIGKDAVAAYAAGVGQAAYATDSAQGGTGGYGKDGANAMAGAATTLDDTVFGVSDYGTLALRQTAYGGAGGGSTGGTAGQGGNATSILGITDRNENDSDQIIESKLLVGYVHAVAGTGGSGYSGSNGANGGAAVATLQQKGYYQVGEVVAGVPHGAHAQGGYGGNGAVGGQGGTAQATDQSTTLNYKSSSVFAYATSHGGRGGDGTAGNGGAGGAGTLAKADAVAAKETTGGHAYARSVESGGIGGTASGSGNTAGAGGAVSNATAYAYGYSARSIVAQYGGAGGTGNSGASGGAGANSKLINDVGGATNGGDPATLPPPGGYIDSGYLKLDQYAHGGAGGVGNGAGAAAGSAGYGYSYLSFIDENDASTESNFHAGTLTAVVGGYGGAGGTGASGGGAGGAAKGILTLMGYGQVTGTANAKGGAGPDSANGGAATATAHITSGGYGAGATATATADAVGGFTNGTMGTATADARAVTARGQQATATGTAYGTDASDQTSAQTTDSVSTLVLETTAATSTSTPFTDYDETMTSAATIGGAAEPVNNAGGTGFSWASGLPTGTAVTNIINPTLLAGQPEPYPQIYDSLNPSHDSDATVLGYGLEGVDTNEASSGTTVTSTQTYFLTATALAGELELGLASGAAYGAVNDITLTVTVGGVTELNVGYASVSQMVTFFTDDMQDLGSFSSDTIPTGGLPVTITLAVATIPGASTISGFEGNFLLASSGVRSPPMIDLASPRTVIGVGKPATIGDISISEAGDTTGDTFTVTVSDTHGGLSASKGGGSATITQVSSTDVKIVGSLNDVNDALATIADTNGTTGSDPIAITASDTNGNSATPANYGVTVNGLPVIATPVNRVTLEVDEPAPLAGYNADFSAIVAITVAETGSFGTPETFTVTVSDSDGKLAEGIPVLGVTYDQLSAGELQIEGGLNAVNVALGNITAQNVAGGTITVNASDSFLNNATQQTFTFGVQDTAAEAQALTQAQVNQLATDGVTSLSVAGTLYLTVQQAGYFAAAGISINDGSGVYISDTAAAIGGMSTTAISQLPGLGVFAIIANDSPLVLTVSQAMELEAISLSAASTPSGSVTLTATIDDFEDSASPTYLSPSVLSKLAGVGFTGITVTGPSGSGFPLSVAQAQALGGASPVLHITPPPGGGDVGLADTVAAIEALQPSDYTSLDQIGIGVIVPTDGLLQFTVAQAEAIVNDLHATVPPGSAPAISDIAANIKTLLDGGSSGIEALAQYINFTGLYATDGSIALTATEAENLEQANADLAGDALSPVTVVSEFGVVTLADTAADIEGMSAPQIAGLTALGVIRVTATDTGLTLTVPQALAFYDPLPITVPSGDSIVVADTEAEIESLTPQEIAGLVSIGVGTIAVSGLTGAAPVFIDAGVTLAIDGAVPAAQTIEFVGSGGTLEIDDTAGMAGTLYGFSPPDAIDLTDVIYDPSSYAQLDPSNPADDILQVTANSTTYNLQLDPSQVFVTATNFNTAEDAGGNTDVTVSEAPLTYYIQLQSGQTADGLVVNDGGELDVSAGGIANRTTLGSDGSLLVENGATATDAVVGSGGSADVQGGGLLNNGTITTGGSITIEGGGTLVNASIGNGGFLELGVSTEADGAIGFGVAGGTLQIDDTVMPGATITGFAPGDTIDLSAVPFDSSGTATVISGTTLQVIENSATYDLQLDPTQSFQGYQFLLSSDGTQITEEAVPCFLPGTYILTDHGDVLVEALRVGDTVITLSGQKRPLCWIGHGRALATRGRRSAATPVIVRKGALAEHVPDRDLRITKGHALYFDGVLIPAEFLVNHRSILWDDRAQEVTVFHLELDAHDVLVANGAAAESYRDDGNRWLFQNANDGWDQPPKQPCAPVLTGGPVVDAIWQRLLDRAGPRPGLPLTSDPDLHLVVDGRRLDCVSRHGLAHVFQLADAPESLRIVSRSGVPAELGLARDPRMLGVAVRQVALRQASRFRVVEATDPALAEGFYAFEPDNSFRWSDGDAALDPAVFSGFAGAMELVLHLGGVAQYALTGGDRAVA